MEGWSGGGGREGYLEVHQHPQQALEQASVNTLPTPAGDRGPGDKKTEV